METSTLHQMEAERRSGRSPNSGRSLNSGRSPNRAAAGSRNSGPRPDAPSAERIYASQRVR
ncbi:hypothetical protein EYF80_055801 [Liparis tanakae]|uniref:Uncharacterized protein n=1 Tax=Liparis tanakae TaxID=230148 RepID=A0A4Z2EYJ1_9TELE|nr:hypothetical protein EYF80_055801 [Liparis tanakae]